MRGAAYGTNDGRRNPKLIGIDRKRMRHEKYTLRLRTAVPSARCEKDTKSAVSAFIYGYEK